MPVMPTDQLWHSERLRYIRYDRNDKVEAFLYKLRSDPLNVQSHAHLPVPHSQASSIEANDSFAEKSMMNLIIALPKADVGGGGGGGASKDGSGELAEEGPTPEDGRRARTKKHRDGQDDDLIYIGIMGVNKPEETMQHNGSASMGLSLLRDYVGKGYGSEAIRWCLWWGFTMARLHRMEIGCVGYNKAAWRLYERLGFKLEGVHREAFWFMGCWHDRVSLSMLDREWKAMKEAEGKREEVELTSEDVSRIMGCA